MINAAFVYQVAAAFGMLPLFQSPMNILCEISNVSKRGFVICVACVGWSLGQILMPLVGKLIYLDNFVKPKLKTRPQIH